MQIFGEILFIKPQQFCGLIKRISPKMCIPCVRVKINKRSFKPFCVWILFQNASSHSVSDFYYQAESERCRLNGTERMPMQLCKPNVFVQTKIREYVTVKIRNLSVLCYFLQTCNRSSMFEVTGEELVGKRQFFSFTVLTLLCL